MSGASELPIRLMNGPDEASACATIMASTDPWKRLGRRFEDTLKTVTSPSEVYVATDGEEIVGLVIIAMNIPLIRGYILGLAVKEGRRDRGIGTGLLRFAEQRIFRDSPNVFMCVSTFNTAAQRLYERLGYKRVGVLEDFAIAGEGEILLRKTIGPQATFKRKPPA
jgi:ribosomal protein S18 acetylase RimI-like enzyme